eukprot:5630821-Pleurochrysis_carterae.AAC.1
MPPTPSPPRRDVCMHTFLAHYPLGESTVLRMINKKRQGLPAYPVSDAHELRKLKDTDKTLSIV